jgi:hypothetical protein
MNSLSASAPNGAVASLSALGRRGRAVLVLAFVLFAVLAAGGFAKSASAANYYYCGVLKSPASWCPLLSQLPSRHTYTYNYTYDDGSSCGGHRMAAFVAYVNSNANSAKYDWNSNQCNRGEYFFPNNTELLRLYGQHFNPGKVNFSGLGSY